LIVRVSEQRCRNHAVRTAAGRCPGCHFFYCRECITEHDGRMLCAACVQKQFLKDASDGAGNRFWTAGLLAAAFAATWFLLAAGEGLVWQIMQPR
jgi:hypothetical protein